MPVRKVVEQRPAITLSKLKTRIEKPEKRKSQTK
jgi:hypothetical protein